MPHGTYTVAGRSEAFSCAPGPAGWRYVSDTLDLVCDSAFRCARVQVTAGSAWARGGRSLLDDGTPVLTWLTSTVPGSERHAAVTSVDVASPGALVALVRYVAAPGDAPVSRDVAALRFDAPSLAGLSVRLRVTRRAADTHAAPGGSGVLLAEDWTVDDLDDGTRRELHVAGDVVLAATLPTGDVELLSLDSPPSLLRPSP